ncbi:MAG: vWA domain-containing protein [Pirellulales bacterium]
MLSKRLKLGVCASLVASSLLITAVAPARAEKKPSSAAAAVGAQAPVPNASVPRIQMAILLDTSSSMSGLINQARNQLWRIVNEFATAKRDGKSPYFEVALYEYGHAPLGAKGGFIRNVVPLSDDLDKVSEELFKLTTNGGDEYCGMVIERAVSELKWSPSNRDLKCIFIAGNEPFTQGPVDYRTACKAAIEKGITINTIHCGAENVGVSTMWLDGSKMADGSFMNINHNQVVHNIAAPQDKELAALSAKLNTTYVAYGSAKKRKEVLTRQTEQDANAANASQAVAAQRAQTKASRFYSNAGWDLCDAWTKGVVKIEELKEEDLPEFMRKMSLEDRKAHIEKKVKEREAIKKQMQELVKARSAYVAAEMKKLADKGDNTLDQAIVETARSQAVKKSFKFE